jgi:hypothetical protein
MFMNDAKAKRPAAKSRKSRRTPSAAAFVYRAIIKGLDGWKPGPSHDRAK